MAIVGTLTTDMTNRALLALRHIPGFGHFRRLIDYVRDPSDCGAQLMCFTANKKRIGMYLRSS